LSKGYMGKVLWADLSKSETWEEEIGAETYEQVLSGMGLAAQILFKSIPKGADPLGPDNVLGLVSGLLTGTGASMTGRWMATGKSPLTGGWGDANGGGHFSPAIKRAGYDGIFVKGVSEKPVYLKVVDGNAEILDASHLWGLDVVETEARIKEDLSKKNLQVACIGQAGENLSLIAGIVTDGARIAARSGLGAVMGSKKLKAVVVSGNTKIETQDKNGIKRKTKKYNNWTKSADKPMSYMSAKILRILAKAMRILPFGVGAGGAIIPASFRAFGTIVTNVLSAEAGDSPVKNWKGVGMRDYPMSTHSGMINPTFIIERQKQRYNCSSCPIGCGGILELKGKTRFDLDEVHKPEYETCASFGSLILNNDLDSIYYINDILNRAGMDTISAGSAVAFAMECYEQGVLTKEDLDGLDLKWGNSDAVIELVKKMVEREGIGDKLADGSKFAAERIGKGSEKYAMHVGGQDLPMHDGRLDPGFAVAYSFEPTPARHTNYCYMYLEMFGLHNIFPDVPKVDMLYTKSSRTSTKDREIALSAASKYIQILNGAGGCLFAAYAGIEYPLLDYINLATGWKKTPNDYLEIGERIQHLRQAFNIKHGVVPGNDFKMPGRTIGNPPLEMGPLRGVKVPINELNRNFAKAIGWEESGKPEKSRLEELGLSYVAAEIYPEGA